MHTVSNVNDDYGDSYGEIDWQSYYDEEMREEWGWDDYDDF